MISPVSSFLSFTSLGTFFLFSFSVPTGLGEHSRYSDSLLAGRSRDRILVGARFSALVQTGPGAHPASCTMGTGSFPGIKRPGRDADHPPSSKCRGHERVGLAITLLTLWAFVACYGEKLYFYEPYIYVRLLFDWQRPHLANCLIFIS